MTERLIESILLEMKAQRVSRLSLSEDLGVNRKTVEAWFKGATPLPVWALLIICDILGLRVLITREDD